MIIVLKSIMIRELVTIIIIFRWVTNFLYSTNLYIVINKYILYYYYYFIFKTNLIGNIKNDKSI